MSKYVKNLMVKEIVQRLEGVQDALLVNVVGIDANATVTLRRELREKDIHLLVVKNGMARRATEGTALAPAFTATEGTLAVIWGGEDFISLVKEVSRLDKSRQYEHFKARGGVMDGERLTPDRVREIAKWPNRLEQLSILSGQILSPGAQLVSQLIGPGAALASQIEKKAEEEGEALPE
ncbi:MAG: 50S ribosomal protein L10 [Pirellulaceae bacterium]